MNTRFYNAKILTLADDHKFKITEGELLKIAGVNLETPAPIQDALNAFEEIIKEMETLVED